MRAREPWLRLGLADTAAMLRLFTARERGRLGFLLLDSLLLPAAICHLGVRVAGRAGPGRTWFLTGGIAMGLGTGAIYLVGAAVLDDRFRGRLQLLRVQPTIKLAYHLANVALAVVSAAALLFVAIAALAFLHAIDVTPGVVGMGMLLALLAGGSLGGLGGAVASRAHDYDLGYTTLSAVALGLACASPVFYPQDALPGPLRVLAQLSPMTHAASVLRSLTAAHPVPLDALAALTVLAVAINLGAYRLLRW
jgi:ABC-2 type transport system permease protein